MSHPDLPADFLKATRKKAKKSAASGPRSASRAESASLRSKSSASLDRPRDFPRDWVPPQAPPTGGNHARNTGNEALKEFDFSGAAQNIGYSWEIQHEEATTPVDQQRPIRNIFSLKKGNKPAPLDHKSHSAPDARLQQYHLPTPHGPDSPLDLQGKLDRIGTNLIASSPSTPANYSNRQGHARDQSPPPRSAFDHVYQETGRTLSPEPASAHHASTSPSDQTAPTAKLSKRSARSNASPQAPNGSQKSHIFQVASTRPAPSHMSGRANLSPPTSPDLGSTYGAAVQQSRSGNSPPMSETRGGPEVFPPTHPISRWHSGSLRSSFSTVDSEVIEPIHQTRTAESEPLHASEKGLALETVTSADSARSLDLSAAADTPVRTSETLTTDNARKFNPLSSNPPNSSMFCPGPTASSTVQENPKSFSRPDLNQHHSTSIRSGSGNTSLHTTSPSVNMSRPSPRIYTHHNVSDISVDASTPSPILEESGSESGMKALDTSFKDLNHYDVSPIDEDEDFDFSSPGPDMSGYGDSAITATTRAQELERRWMATNQVR